MTDNAQQTRACEQLLAAVVACALRDLASEGGARAYRSKDDKGTEAHKVLRQAGLSEHAFTAVRFLFDKNSTGVEAYLQWLDIDPEHFRAKLLDVIDDSSPKMVAGWMPEQRRAMRVNLANYFRLVNRIQPGDLDHDDSD